MTHKYDSYFYCITVQYSSIVLLPKILFLLFQLPLVTFFLFLIFEKRYEGTDPLENITLIHFKISRGKYHRVLKDCFDTVFSTILKVDQSDLVAYDYMFNDFELDQTDLVNQSHDLLYKQTKSQSFELFVCFILVFVKFILHGCPLSL